jgi:hypothetical protein
MGSKIGGEDGEYGEDGEKRWRGRMDRIKLELRDP